MKKTFSVISIMLVAIFCIIVTGCDNSSEIPADSKYIGTWEAVKAEFKGEEQDINEVLDGDKFIITLKNDGTVEVESDENNTGTWVIIKNGVKLKGDTKLKLKENGDYLTTKILGMTLYFEKK